MGQTHRQTDIQTDGHSDSMTDPAQSAEKVKIHNTFYQASTTKEKNILYPKYKARIVRFGLLILSDVR